MEFLKAILYLAGRNWHSFKLRLIVWCFDSRSSPILRADIHVHLQRASTQNKTSWHSTTRLFPPISPWKKEKKEQSKAEINFHWLVFLLSVKTKRVGCPLSSLHGSPTPDLGTSHEWSRNFSSSGSNSGESWWLQDLNLGTKQNQILKTWTFFLRGCWMFDWTRIEWNQRLTLRFPTEVFQSVWTSECVCRCGELE